MNGHVAKKNPLINCGKFFKRHPALLNINRRSNPSYLVNIMLTYTKKHHHLTLGQLNSNWISNIHEVL